MGCIIIDAERCKGCEICVEQCAQKCIVIDKSAMNLQGYHPAVYEDNGKCKGCKICGDMCPDVCIEVYK